MKNNVNHHPTFSSVFKENKLTVGLFLPLKQYDGSLTPFHAHIKHIKQIDQAGFAALWVRDIPLFDPGFGDVGQVYDPLTYLSFLAGQTQNIALGTGSIVLPLHHPVSLAKTTASLDQLSNGRLLLGVGSGDRYPEYQAFTKSYENRSELFREVLRDMQTLHHTNFPKLHTTLTKSTTLDLVPKPFHSHIPVLVTGASQQSLQWIAEHADGWMSYPGPTTTIEDTLHLQQKIKAFRDLIPDSQFKPHMTNEWIELDEDPDFPRTPLRGGFILKTGRKGLLELLYQWQKIGVNHAALGIQFGKREISETLDELAKEILPHFPTLN